MIPNEKNIKALIKKTQKKCETAEKIKKAVRPKDDEPFERDTALEMFQEMQKLPFKD